MPTATAQQVSFNGGELAPRLYGRTDLEKYDSCVKTMKNFIPTLQGDIVNRPGTKFVCEVKDSTKNVRLIPFQFSVTQAYVLEFGDLYMRIIADGGQVVYPVGHASAGDPVEVVTPFAHTDLDRIQFTQSADVLFLVHPSYPPQKVSRFSNTEWTVEAINFGSSAATPDNIVSSSVGSTYAYKVTSIVGGEESIAGTGSSSSQTSNLSWDAVFGATSYNIYKEVNGIYGWIGEAGSNAFTDATITPDDSKRPPDANNPFSADPVLEEISANIVPDMIYVSPVSVAGGGWTATATNWYGSGPYYLRCAFDPAFPTIDYITLTTTVPTTIIEIVPDAPVAVGAYSFVMSAAGLGAEAWTFEGYDGASWVTLDTRVGEVSWAANEKRTYDFVNEVAYEKYHIVINKNNTNTNYSRFNKIEMHTATYSTAANYPGSATIHQQRLILARTDAKPQTIFGSQTGNYYNFNVSSPLQDDDSYEFTVASNQVNEIQWMSAIRTLLLGTAGSEWEMDSGSASNSITPTNVNLKPQGNRGSEPIEPIIIGNSLLFISRGGSSIRDYGYNFDVDGYTGDELTLLASHLFEDSSVRAWAFQKAPYSVVWVVMEDGSLVGLTYDKDQKVIAWHQHETEGTFESVAVIPGS
jgi:hypothetical protein